MRVRLRTISVAFLLAGWLFPSGGAMLSEDLSLRVPEVHGSVLSGEPVNLPDVFKGKVGVLVVGFSPGAREEVAAWGRRLASDFADANGVVYFEVGMFGSVPKLVRGLVMRKVKDSVPVRARGHFLPVDDHEAQWKTVTGFQQSESAYVLIVDSSGAVRWRTHGPATDATFGDLKKNVESAQTSR